MEASIIITLNHPKPPNYLPSSCPRASGITVLVAETCTSTLVENPLQIGLFPQNKPNPQNPKTDPNSYTTRTYTNIPLRPARKNKPKTNPTKLADAPVAGQSPSAIRNPGSPASPTHSLIYSFTLSARQGRRSPTILTWQADSGILAQAGRTGRRYNVLNTIQPYWLVTKGSR